jgi:hypothetical protein
LADWWAICGLLLFQYRAEPELATGRAIEVRFDVLLHSVHKFYLRLFQHWMIIDLPETFPLYIFAVESNQPDKLTDRRRMMKRHR